jgi:hypothetical protein
MPYYNKKHILFIHIPKTGGTTIENELAKNDNSYLRSCKSNKLLPPPFHKTSLQHQFYKDLLNLKDFCKIDFNDKLKVFCVVRNPYHRLISDLFHFNLIQKGCLRENVCTIIKNYIKSKDTDNHNVPQFKFICDRKGVVYSHIKIYKTENLVKDNWKINNELGCVMNFKNYSLKGKESQDRYMTYLNDESIKIINNFYSRDFELFGYDKILK